MRGVRLTIYDWLGYLVPGTLAVWALVELAMFVGVDLTSTKIFELPATAQVIFLLIICYAAGHLLHALANVTLDRIPSAAGSTATHFVRDLQKVFQGAVGEKLRKAAIQYFDAHEKDPDLVQNYYWACYCTVAEASQESLVHTFLALTGFYRGMCMACFLVALAFVASGLVTEVWRLVIIGLVVAALGWMFQRRVARFRSYLVRTVAAEFLEICKGRLPKPPPSRADTNG